MKHDPGIVEGEMEGPTGDGTTIRGQEVKGPEPEWGESKGENRTKVRGSLRKGSWLEVTLLSQQLGKWVDMETPAAWVFESLQLVEPPTSSEIFCCFKPLKGWGCLLLKHDVAHVDRYTKAQKPLPALRLDS